MPSFISECDHYFASQSLYDIFGVDKKCKPSELKKAFYDKSRLYHPDRHLINKPLATKQFQTLSKAYSILADQEKRKIYDETGLIDNEDSIDNKSYEDWRKYFDLIFPKITEEDINKFFDSYRGSEQEREDVKRYYVKYQGDMDPIMESVLSENEYHVKNIIQDLIDTGCVKPFKSFTQEPKKKTIRRAKRAKMEADLFAEGENEPSNGMGSLLEAFAANRESRLQASESFIDKLAAKYTDKPKSLNGPKRARKKAKP